VTTKLNRSHLVHGRDALMLPCLGRSEIDLQAAGPQAITVEDSMSMVHLSVGMNPPASPQLMSEPAIVARLAHATLPASRTPWLALVEDYDRIRDRIARVVPGFEDFNARVRAPGGFHLYHPASERRFATADGKASFHAHALDDPAVGDATLLRLTTMRSHDQYNTTIYGLDDRYRGVRGHRRVCFISRGDLARLGFAAGEYVDITSVWHDGERTAANFLLVEYDIPAGCIASYFPETNALVPLDSYAERARTPTSKSIEVRLSRAGMPAVAESAARPAGDAAIDELVPRLLQLLADEEGVPLQRATKRLGLSTSELHRLLASLGDDPRYDGLDLVVARRDGERTLLWLTDKGRALCGRT
ncbi:MAG TPA: molybdopterin dinucleotide binding domain-containing protein, partial [Candidatus Saccharimonadia bacterium]|nr:molybdopterin dinucleotide binding domain-containing protein [Candidatus Saccharimonadia bacterium]